MKVLARFSFILLFTILISSTVYAKAGYIIISKGKVKVISLNQGKIYSELNVKIDVNDKDEIHTGSNTRAKLMINNDNEVISLYSNTFMTVKSVDDNKSFLSLPIGKARFLVHSTMSRLKKKRRFRVRTSNAVVGVKGTDFVVQTSGTRTNILTIEGVVTMANASAPNVTIEVKKNQASTTKKSAPPAKPIKVSPESQQKILTQDKPVAWEGIDFEESESETTTKKSSTKNDKSESESETKNEETDETQTMDTDSIESVANIFAELAEINDIIDEVQQTTDEIKTTIDEILAGETLTEIQVNLTIDK